MADIIDVVIVGADLSGLQAASDVYAAGRSVILLEARNRVGGKTSSIERIDGKGVQEIGAAWLNDSSQSLFWSYCRRFGLTPVVQNIKGLVASEDADGLCHLFPFGEMPLFEKLESDNIAALSSAVEAASLNPETFKEPKRTELKHITFERFCRDAGAGNLALQTARVWCRGTLGQDPSDVSALAYLEIARGAQGLRNLRYDGEGGAQHLRLREGTQSIAIGISRLLPSDSFRLSTPVSHITKITSRLYAITTTRGDVVKARKVIVSVPGPAYKNISFSPPLPPQKQAYITATRYGCFVKFTCLFKTPFWREQGCCGLTQSFRGPMNHCRDTSVDQDNNYALTCFLCAGPGLQWSILNEEDRREAVLKQLGSLFGVGHEAVKSEFLSSITTEWMQDRWAGWGCPFAAPPFGSAVGGKDGTAIDEKFDGVYFVGTELTDEWRGYMEGALRSGKRGAAQVSKDLQVEDTRF